jgi:hypothetical protein
MSLASTRQRSARAARNGEHAGAGADIEHAPDSPGLEQAVERKEAAARCAVMAGTEGKRRLDLDADAVWRNPAAVMRAMDEETARLDGCEPLEARRHPVGPGDRREGDARPRLFAGEAADERAYRLLIGSVGEKDLDGPAVSFASAVAVRGAAMGCDGRGAGIESLGESIDEPLRRRGIRHKSGHGGLVGWVHHPRSFHRFSPSRRHLDAVNRDPVPLLSL